MDVSRRLERKTATAYDICSSSVPKEYSEVIRKYRADADAAKMGVVDRPNNDTDTCCWRTVCCDHGRLNASI